ncbi:MAG: STAS domain-containing protein [Flexilinea sp.]|nr:STAS domain-containing protein [Flexilinea sp.]
MSNETDYRAVVNPIYLTAKTAVCLMADAEIPGADEIVRKLGVNHSDLGMADPDMMLGNELVVEAKYRTMCRLIEESGIKTNADLPCGYTPKALHMTEKGLRFVGLDLPIVAQEVEPVILSLAAHPDQIQIHGIDATNLDSLITALSDVDGPVCISTEGMMMYFTESEASAVVSNISHLLAKHGGCWITPDPEFMVQFFLTFQSVLGEKAIRKLEDSRKTATGQSDVLNLTNSFIIRPTDIKGTLETSYKFLQKHNLKAERINLAENMPELNAYRKLTPDQITAFKTAMANCFYWKITLDENQKLQTEKQETKPFELSYTLKDKMFSASLSGRMDTITAPELLKAWEKEKAENEITAVEIDCSGLQYISSAGLRVLLMIYKSLEDKSRFRMSNVSDDVLEILEVTGFDQFLLRV